MIVHVTDSQTWEKYIQHEDYYSPSFEEEGFIHCSTQMQLEGVLFRYFRGKTDILILHIDEENLTSRLEYELSTGGELFPHIYGPINKSAILKIERLE